MKKYKVTEESIEIYGRKLFRMEAEVDIEARGVKKGDKGGFIEVSGDAKVSGDAWVSGNAKVFGNAKVSGDAWVSGNAKVFGNAKVSGDAEVFGEIKCETGYYFAHKRKEWTVEEIEVDDQNVVLWRK